MNRLIAADRSELLLLSVKAISPVIFGGSRALPKKLYVCYAILIGPDQYIIMPNNSQLHFILSWNNGKAKGEKCLLI